MEPTSLYGLELGWCFSSYASQGRWAKMFGVFILLEVLGFRQRYYVLFFLLETLHYNSYAKLYPTDNIGEYTVCEQIRHNSQEYVHMHIHTDSLIEQKNWGVKNREGEFTFPQVEY